MASMSHIGPEYLLHKLVLNLRYVSECILFATSYSQSPQDIEKSPQSESCEHSLSCSEILIGDIVLFTGMGFVFKFS